MMLDTLQVRSIVKAPRSATCRGRGRPSYERCDMAKAICSVEGCERYVKGWGLCSLHYQRYRVHGNSQEWMSPQKRTLPSLKPCSVQECERPSMARELCSLHYDRLMNGHDPHTWKPTSSHDVVDGQKYCPDCKEWKPLKEFTPAPRNRSGCSTYCHPCQSARAVAAYQKLTPSQRSTHNRKRHILSKYGLTIERYEEILKSQGGTCICGATASGQRSRKFHVDHDHETGEIRGVLCHGCNTALGLVKEDPTRLRLLAQYLEGQWRLF